MLLVFRTLVACDLSKLTLVNLANEFSVARLINHRPSKLESPRFESLGVHRCFFFSPARSAKNLKTVFFNFDLHDLLVCSGVKFLARN